MKKTRIGLIIAIIMLIGILATTFASYANNQQSIFVNLTKTNADGIGYGIGNPTGDVSGEAPYIWNINTYTDISGTTLTNPQKNLYCVKADYGYSWEDSTDVDNPPSPANVVEYNLSYDLLTAREKVLAELMDDSSRELIETLLDSENGNYNELLWILDNAYVPDEKGITYKNEFLERLGFQKEYTNIITDEDIKAVQKAAIWYFTNPEDSKFDKVGPTNWLFTTTDGGDTYNALAFSTDPRKAGEERNEQANILYNYLIAEAEKNADYLSPTTAPISAVNTTIQTTRISDRYVVGPIKINKNNDLLYKLNPLQVTDKTGNLIEFKYREQQDGQDLETLDISKYVGNENGFYISIARNTVTEINITLTGNYLTTNKTLWLSSIVQNGEIKLVGEQPLVEITKEEQPLVLTFNSKPDEFDLALRKYITAVNGNTVSNTRVPVIDESTLNTETTATYKHRKDPVVVEDHNEVTYQIAIYNEGNKAGYASKIIDQLPEGLVLSTEYDLSQPIQSNKNTYNLAYDTTLNQIILTITETTETPIQSLNPYTINNLDCEIIEIKCIVAQEADETNQTVLTNVAWIDEAYEYDETQQKYVVSDNDRDSSPEDAPSVDKDNMSAYRGSTSGNELSDSEFFYEGQEDDDDFEKLVLEPDPKIFDLELVKFIAAVSDDAQIDEDEYLLDENGLYERAPKISIVQEQDSEDRRIHCDWSPSNKNPLLVEEGDYVLYTIRVYNAGEQDGYAAEIKDHLPVGLVHVEPTDELAEYYGIWNVDTYEDTNGDERQILSTNHLAKGQGAELDAVQGETRYTANLLRALDPTSDVVDGETRNPDYRDVQVLCQVTSDAQKDGVLINFAQISKDTDKDGKEVDDDGNDVIVDEDSTPGNMPETGPHEDDEDYEKIRLQHFDLSLRKFITAVDGNEISTRIPNEDTAPLVRGEDTAEYNHPKQPVEVQIGDEVIYTIRVYNEGTIDGFASEIKDYLPPYLTYNNDSEINETYEWEISENGRVATTRYLENTVLKAFDGGEDLYGAEVKIACIVSKDAPAKEVQTNIAEISEYKYNGIVVTTDIDSTSDNMTLPSDENLPSYKQDELDKEYVPGNEDDDDFEKIYVKPYDLSLRKFITSVDGKEISTREPDVDTTPLKNGEDTAIYNHPKQPIAVKVGDKIVYTIRVYNEGKVDGIASEVKDYLPEYLKYDKDSEINEQYGWQISDDGRIATTTYLEDTELKAFDGGDDLDFADVKIECIVAEDAPLKEVQTNIAEISEYTFNDIVVENDIDSESDNMVDEIPSDEELPSYKQDELDKEYVPGNEDDDDFEKIYVKQFDFALRKFITKIKDTEVTTRVPQVDVTPLTKGEDTAIYEHSKEPLTVHVGDVVIYTIRVYNEGEIAGYASEITDDIPEYLEYLPEDTTNVQYMWKMYDENGNETDKVEEAVSVKTNYLSKENGEDNLIKAFDGTTLDYKEVEVAFKVKNPNSNKHIITNCAQISEDTDENGNPVNDKDSDTEKWNDGEDDQDIENIKVEYFDLSLLKFVSKVIIIEDGKEKISETGYNGHEDPEPVVKVELHKKKLSDVIVKFGYGITITNEGDIAGYATELTDYVPEGLKFDPNDNPEWTDEGNNVISTRQLENVLLQPGERKTVEVIFTWINGADNMGLKTNTAEISEDKNEYDVPDKDSTPDNKVEGEDDIDIAKVILNISTGAAKTYFALTLGLLVIVLAGVVLIKKFVL